MWQQRIVNWVPISNLRVLRTRDIKTVFTKGEKHISMSPALKNKYHCSGDCWVAQLKGTEPEGTWETSNQLSPILKFSNFFFFDYVINFWEPSSYLADTIAVDAAAPLSLRRMREAARTCPQAIIPSTHTPSESTPVFLCSVTRAGTSTALQSSRQILSLVTSIALLWWTRNKA